jgi:hypothetical protein
LLVDLLCFNPDVVRVEAARIATQMRTLIHTAMTSVLKLLLTAARNDCKLVQIKLLTRTSSSKFALNVAGAVRR